MSGAAGLKAADPKGASSAGGRIQVGFAGFGQTQDAKQRTVRYTLQNTSRKAIVSVRLVLRYRSAAGASLGSFPLNVVRRIAPGETVSETTDLIGHSGPPEEVRKVDVIVDSLSYGDGTGWRAVR
ncbi:MAG: hypothetical protein ABI333_08485 [bacterium]